MSLTEQEFDKVCLVCGKSLDRDRGLVRLNVEGRWIALCCPLCYEVYQKDPPRFLAKLALFNLRPPGVSDTGFHP